MIESLFCSLNNLDALFTKATLGGERTRILETHENRNENKRRRNENKRRRHEIRRRRTKVLISHKSSFLWERCGLNEIIWTEPRRAGTKEGEEEGEEGKEERERPVREGSRGKRIKRWSI